MSRERIAYLTRLLVEQMDRNESIRLLKDREVIRQSIFHVLLEEMRQHEERQAQVRQRLLSDRKSPPRGTPEWENLFQRLVEEEYERHVFESL